MSNADQRIIFETLMNHVGMQVEVTLSNNEVVYGRLLSFNKLPLALNIESKSLHLINFSHVIQVRFPKPK